MKFSIYLNRHVFGMKPSQFRLYSGLCFKKLYYNIGKNVKISTLSSPFIFFLKMLLVFLYIWIQFICTAHTILTYKYLLSRDPFEEEYEMIIFFSYQYKTYVMGTY